MTGRGGRPSRKRFTFYTQKISPISEFVNPKKSLSVFTIYISQFYHKYNTLAVNCAYVFIDLSWWKTDNTQKDPRVLIDPKIIPLGQNFRPKKILRNPLPHPPPSLKYVSGVPGLEILSHTVNYCKIIGYSECRYTQPTCDIRTLII